MKPFAAHASSTACVGAPATTLERRCSPSEDATRDMDQLPQALARARRDLDRWSRCTSSYRQAERDAEAAREMAADAGDEGLRRRGARRRRARAWSARGRAAEGAAAARTRTTSATSSSRSAPAPAATSRRCSPATCSACTRATPSASAGRSRSSRESAGELGGYKEVIARIVGEGAYSKLKFESGGHRVQRVPGPRRRAASTPRACTVAVLPEPDEVDDVELNPAELRIDTFRASRRRRPARQQDRLGGPHHAPADRHRGRMPGRPLAAQEPREGAERARRAHPRQAAARAAGEGPPRRARA